MGGGRLGPMTGMAAGGMAPGMGTTGMGLNNTVGMPIGGSGAMGAPGGPSNNMSATMGNLGTTMGGFRPQTGHQVPGTGAQRGASRMGTAARMGTSLNTEVKVAERPLTQMGVKGMHTGVQGPGRQVYDKTYYMTQLRQKIQELTQALQSFNKEITEISNDNSLYASYEKRYDQLIRTVRTYEGDLADYNLALDKQRTDTRPEEVNYMYALLKNQNDTQRQEMDAIFLEKKSHEEQIKKIDEELRDIEKQNEELLNGFHPDQLEDYMGKQEDIKNFTAEIAEMKSQYEDRTDRLMQQESRMRVEPLRIRKTEMMEQKRKFEYKVTMLEEEASQASLSIPEQRDMLLAKVKSDNQEIVMNEKQISEIKMDIEKYKRLLSEMQTDIEEKKGESNDQQKYEILFSKDQEMSSFIGGFDQAKENETECIKTRQTNICQLLESISKNLIQSKNVSAEEKAKDMEDELEFKNKQLQNSASTHQRLQGELEKREGELDKINSLDVKITTELQQLELKINQYQNELKTTLEFVDDMKADKENQISNLQRKRVGLETREAALKKQVNFLELRYEGKKQQLLENETYNDLEAQEQKLKQYEQNLFHLQTFISTKTAETDYQPQLKKLLDTSEQVNQIIQKQLTHKMPIY